MSGRATARCSRARISRLRGPGISVRISITRVAATRGSLDRSILSSAWTSDDLADDPWSSSRTWLDDAREAVSQPDAMIARDSRSRRTAVRAGRAPPRTRRPRDHVLHEPDVAQGRRAARTTPDAAAVVHWWELGRQVRIEGAVERDDATRSRRAYWQIAAARQPARGLGITAIAAAQRA